MRVGGPRQRAQLRSSQYKLGSGIGTGRIKLEFRSASSVREAFSRGTRGIASMQEHLVAGARNLLQRDTTRGHHP